MKEKLIFLLYLIPAILISSFFLIHNQVEIVLKSDQKGLEFTYDNQVEQCQSNECKFLVPRNLKAIQYSKENILPGVLKINTFKSREYFVKTQKIAFLKEVNIDLGKSQKPFLVKKENEKYILFANYESLFPLASFPSFKNIPEIFYSENLNFILLKESSSDSFYLFDTKNNKKVQIEAFEHQEEIKVLNSGDLLYKNDDGPLIQIDRDKQIKGFYKLETLDHILELDNGSLLIIAKDIASVLTNEDGINFAYEVSKSIFNNQTEESYKVYLYKNESNISEVLDLKSKSGPFRLLRVPKVNNKIYLESLDGLFEIEL